MPQHEGSDQHRWLVAAEVPIMGRDVRRALLRQSFRAEPGLRVNVLDIYCGECRRGYVDVADQPCICKVTTRHLRGGPDGRKRRGPVPIPRAVTVELDDLPTSVYVGADVAN